MNSPITRYQEIVEQEKEKLEARKAAIKSRKKSPIGIAAFIDVETTGLSSFSDEIIEFAIVLFSFEKSTGRILDIIDEYCSFREPSIPISEQASRVNGIYMSNVKGQRLNYRRIEDMLDQCDFLISHNAEFDRAFVEKLLYVQVVNKKWYCSMRGINWKKQGCPTMNLQDLLKRYYIDCGKAHRALDDCRATVKLLSRCGRKGKTFLSELLKHGPQMKSTTSNNYSGCIWSVIFVIILFLLLKRCG